MARILATVFNYSAEGAASLLAAVGQATREPERAGYLIAAELAVWSSLFKWNMLKMASKPVLMPLLAGRILRSPAKSTAKTLGLLGLLGGYFGDVVLLRHNRLALGAAGFALNHLSYIGLLWQRGARLTAAGVAVRAIPLAASIGLSAWKNPRLLPVVAGYGSLLSAVSVLGDDPVLTPHRWDSAMAAISS